MAATTVKAIIDRFQAVMEGANVNLRKTTDEFTFDRQPNTRVNDVYRIEDLGLIETQTLTNNVDARLDEIGVWIARKGALNTEPQRETMETDMNTIERLIVSDGRSNNYKATLLGREIQRPDGSELLIGLLRIQVDYDYSLNT